MPELTYFDVVFKPLDSPTLFLVFCETDERRITLPHPAHDLIKASYKR
jgi:hypothetical protein